MKSGWQKTTLKEVCTLVTDGTHDSPKLQTQGIPFIKGKHISGGYLDFENCDYITFDEHLVAIKRSKPEKGDILMSNIGSVGDTAFINTDKEFSIKNVALLKPDPAKVYNRYLYYYVISDLFQSQLQNVRQGVAQPFISLDRLRSFEITLVDDIKIQCRIASILSAYDDLIENNTRRIKILEEIAKLIYREWFVEWNIPPVETQFIASQKRDMRAIKNETRSNRVSTNKNELRLRKATAEEKKVTGKDVFPEGWEIKKLEDVALVIMGQSPESKYYNETGEGLPFHQGVTDFGSRYPTDRVFTTVMNRIAEEGDVLFSVRAPVGRLNIATKKMVLGRGLSGIRSKSGQQEFLFQQLIERFKEEDSMGSGTIFKSVTRDDMLSIPFIQPVEKQVKMYQDTAIPMFKELRVLNKHNANLRQTRDLLIPKLVSGEVEV